MERKRAFWPGPQYHSPFQNYVTLGFSASRQDKDIIITVSNGRPPYKYYLDDVLITQSDSKTCIFPSVTPGWHELRVSDKLRTSIRTFFMLGPQAHEGIMPESTEEK